MSCIMTSGVLRLFWPLLAGLVLLSGCGDPQPQHEPLPPGSTVLVLGDSLAAGMGASAAESYPSALAQMTPWRVLNEGISGDTTQGGRERLPELLDEHRPQLVIIELGGNDFLRRAPVAQVKENLRAMIREAQKRQVAVVLVAIPQPSMAGAATGFLKDAELYRELAEELQVVLVPKAVSKLMGDDSMKSDPIHLNAEGYLQLAENIHKELEESGLLATR